MIERAELEFDDGCCALTGETGAGKTLLVAALGLLLGARSDRTLVREGETSARVEGRFVVEAGHPAVALLSGHDVPCECDGGVAEIVVARTVEAEGRGGRARINGHLVTNSLLAGVGEMLVEVTGQDSTRGLGDPARQRSLLDDFAGPDVVALAGEVADAVGAARGARRELDSLIAGARERERELDVLRYEIDEIRRAAPAPGERDELSLEAERREHAESIAAGLNAALEMLRDEGGVDDLLGRARRSVDESARRDPALGELVTRIEAAAIELADVAGELSRSIVAPDPDALEVVRARLATIGRLTRKYGADEREVLEYLERAEARAAELEDSEEARASLEQRVEELSLRAASLAADLSRRRAEAAGRLQSGMERLLGELALAGARFAVQLRPRDLYEGGVDAVEFHVAADPREAPRPVSKVASGGELSRIALALHLLTTAGTPTLVFDEIDSGVGGRAAHSIGRALARLATESGVQVLVVTHLPQVAAFADAHYRMTMEAGDRRRAARVVRVDSQDRIDELSRMLAGLPESDRAREHAQELLDSASASPADSGRGS